MLAQPVTSTVREDLARMTHRLRACGPGWESGTLSPEQESSTVGPAQEGPTRHALETTEALTKEGLSVAVRDIAGAGFEPATFGL